MPETKEPTAARSESDMEESPSNKPALACHGTRRDAISPDEGPGQSGLQGGTPFELHARDRDQELVELEPAAVPRHEGDRRAVRRYCRAAAPPGVENAGRAAFAVTPYSRAEDRRSRRRSGGVRQSRHLRNTGRASS